jgi:hypothetical protein
MHAVAPLLAAAAAAALASGCSGPAVDSSCDVAGLTAEVEHMVGESRLSLEAIDSLQCSGDWALAEATVSGDPADAGPTRFLLQRTEVGWVLKAPETVCGTQPAILPDALAGAACADPSA